MGETKGDNQVTIESSEVARRLFMRLDTAVNGILKGMKIKKGCFRDISYVRISTDERYQEDSPEKGIFYIKFFWVDEEKPPTFVGIGFLTDRNQIWLDRNAVPDGFWDLLHDYLGFGVIAMSRTFEQMKADLEAMMAKST